MEKDGEKRDRQQTCEKQDGGRGGGEIRLRTQELKTGGKKKVNLENNKKKKSQSGKTAVKDVRVRDGRTEDGNNDWMDG